MAQVQTPAQHLPPPNFFVSNKKGEVNELRQMLKNIMSERDDNKRREVIKKVIAYMTLGVDVSSLFTDMVLISSTTDIVQKKMIYLYLINYAETNQEQALMAINTFFKDCKRDNSDPKIRGLALRNLCSFRFEGAVEYIQPAIEEGLNDPDPYVRRTAIIGVVKLYRFAKDVVLESSFIDTLYDLIRDPDSVVSSNAIIALNEVLEDEGGIAINRKMVIFLLNRISHYTEFGQSIIFDLVARYQPPDEEEKFDVMSLIEERLKNSSSSIVLGCVKVMLNYTRDDPQLTRQVYTRVAPPLITLFTSGEVTGAYELSYSVLAHIHLIISCGGAEVFENEYKNFYCKYDEPTYIRFLKIEILTMIASDNNITEIINELSAYVTDLNTEISKKSIQGLGTIALRLHSVSASIVQQLLSFLDFNIDYVITETLVTMKDIMRKYRGLSTDIMSTIEGSLDIVNAEEGKAAIIWMIGEFGESIDDAPYIIESILDGFNPSENLQVAHALLTACVKLFLKRAPEMHHTLANIFKLVFSECEDADLQDRAGFYYKLLRTNPQQADQIVNTEKHPIASFYEDDKGHYSEILSQEFNQLSVIYRKLSKKFLKGQKNLLSEQPEGPGMDLTQNKQEATAETDLLSLELQEEPQEPEQPQFVLKSNPEMNPEEFQELWMNLDEEMSLSRKLAMPVEVEQVEQMFSEYQIACIASGGQDGEMKFYFYARDERNIAYLVELNVSLNNYELEFVLKVQDQTYSKDFMVILSKALGPLIQA